MPANLLSAMDDFLSCGFVGFPGSFRPLVMVHCIHWHAFGGGFLERFQPRDLGRVRIPRNSATQSAGKLPPSPRQSCHSIHRKVATQSMGFLPRVARQRCPSRSVATLAVCMISLITLLLSTVATQTAVFLAVCQPCIALYLKSEAGSP